MKDKKKLIIWIAVAAVVLIIIICNLFNKNLTGKPGELIGDATKLLNFDSKKPVRGSLDDPDSNINKLLNLDPDREVEIEKVETTKMDNSYSIQYADVTSDKFEFNDFSDSAREYLTQDSYSGVYVLNVLGRVCRDNKIDLASMNLGEDLISADPALVGVSFESNRYRISIFFRDDFTMANVKLDIIG